MKKSALTMFSFLCLAQICHAQWTQTSVDSGVVRCFAVMDTVLFAGTEKGIIRSTNDGTSWDYIVLPDSFFWKNIRSLAVSGKNLLAGTFEPLFHFFSRMHLSTDAGTSWTSIGEGYNIAADASMILVSTWGCADMGCGGQIIISADGGANWTATDFHFDQAGGPACLSINGGNLFVGLAFYNFPGSGVFRSTNEGASWTQVNSGLTDTNVVSLFVYGTTIFAGTDGGVYTSTDNGTSWSQAGLTGIPVLSFARRDMNLFAGTSNSAVFLSTNNGGDWTAVSDGLTNTIIDALVVHGEYLFAGTEGDGVWRRPLNQMITSVEPVLSEFPNECLLLQNYPNPFNPRTVVSYQLPVVSKVTLKIFDLLGREIETLIDEEKPAGTYEVNWNAGNLPSGVYFYQLKAGDFIQSKKMILMK